MWTVIKNSVLLLPGEKDKAKKIVGHWGVSMKGTNQKSQLEIT